MKIKKPRFKFLDTVRVKGLEGLEHQALVIRANQSAFGNTYQLQWMIGEKDTIMHEDNLEKN